MILDLHGEQFYDKVYGCWMGKNSGGTLGGPLEKAYGEAEPFDVWWYPRLEEGGIPNDDLEMQLIWLKALEEVGPDLKAADLAQYWLDHIGYNWDEYGLNKTNLRLGLLPPVSGNYNNWFIDCMGCPIRSEIWACIAPGVPRIAVRYAFEDAIVDHAGGESVFGELFNTAIESAAFVLSDREQLLNIGLSYIPEWSQTAKAIGAARQAFADGIDWKAARRRVLEATPHYNAQYSPINIGFQVVGWLYGTDFGDTICKTVNCGYDTDCTGATVGSFLGILDGGRALPEKWTAPLGESISTNESWGGLRHVSTGVNPVPKNLTELTERVCEQARIVLSANHRLNAVGQIEVDIESLYADDSVRRLWSANPMRIDYAEKNLHIAVDYQDSPAIVPGELKHLVTRLANPHSEVLQVTADLILPQYWSATRLQQPVAIPALASVDLSWDIQAPEPGYVENSNRLLLALHVEGRPADLAIPIILVGASRFRRTDLYPTQGRTDRELFDLVLQPELSGDNQLPSDTPSLTWHDVSARENALPLDGVFEQAGVLYLQTYLWNPRSTQLAWIGAVATCPKKMWINGVLVVEDFRYPLLRPNYDGNREQYANVDLRAGWNEVLIKFVRSESSPPFASHFILADGTPGAHHAGLWQIGRTRFPGEERV